VDNTAFEKLSPENLMALCIWAEARNQGLEGMQAVGSVILNRASHPGWWGKDIKGVILAPKQFSWLNADDPQRERAEKIAQDFDNNIAGVNGLSECWWIARGLIERHLRSNVGQATHYHTTAVSPKWKDSLKQIAQIKDHIFYV
jgi:spore germination cell wall hydrolase CwlJ-like protein